MQVTSEGGTFCKSILVPQGRYSHSSIVCITRTRYGREVVETPSRAAIALLICRVPQQSQLRKENDEAAQEDVDLLEYDFFDDDCIVIVYRLPRVDGKLV